MYGNFATDIKFRGKTIMEKKNTKDFFKKDIFLFCFK